MLPLVFFNNTTEKIQAQRILKPSLTEQDNLSLKKGNLSLLLQRLFKLIQLFWLKFHYPKDQKVRAKMSIINGIFYSQNNCHKSMTPQLFYVVLQLKF